MAFTRGQWEALQARLPEEDRVSFEEYLKSIGATTAPATPLAAAEGGLIAAQSMYRQTTGQPAPTVTTPTTPAGMSIESQRYTAAAIAAGLNPAFNVGSWRIGEEKDRPATPSTVTPNTPVTPTPKTVVSTTFEGTGKNRVKVTKYSDNTETREPAPENEPAPKTVVSTTFEGTGKNRVKVTKYSDNTETREPAPEDEPGPKQVKSVTYRGKGKDRVKITTYTDNTTEETPDPEADQPVTKQVKSVSYKGKGKDRIKVTIYTDNTSEETPDPETAEPGSRYVVSVTYEGKGRNRIKITKYSDNTEERVADPQYSPTKSTQYIGTGANRILRTTYEDDTYSDVPAPEVAVTDISKSSPELLALIQTLQAQNNTFMAQLASQQQQAAVDAKAAAEAVALEKRENAITSLTSLFNRYGLASLVPKIKELAIGGASEATITLQLMESPEYKMRFKANEERLKKNLAVLEPGEYIGLEDRYRQILRAYGLKQFDNDSYVTQFLANDVSPEELSSRVVNAVQRVQNADPAVSAMLRQYYNIGVTDMVAYVLDPNNQLPKIERQIGAAEIGVAAGRQGLTAGVNVAEQLAAQGISQAEAQRGYATIADVLPGATKLSQIYTGVLDQYGQAEAEQEVFNSLASAQRKRRALAEREIATFTGASGLGKTALDQNTRGNF